MALYLHSFSTLELIPDIISVLCFLWQYHQGKEKTSKPKSIVTDDKTEGS